MSDAAGAVFVDLDRTLIGSASGPVFQQAMVAEGVLSAGHRLPATASCTASTTGSASRCPSSGWPGRRPGSCATARPRRPAGPGSAPWNRWSNWSSPGPSTSWPPTGPKAGRLVLATTSPVDLVHRSPMRSGSTMSSPPATPSGTAATPAGWRAGSCGASASGRPWSGGRPTTGSTWAPPTPTPTASSTSPCCSRSATRTRSTPTPGWWRWPWPGGGRWSTGTDPRGCPRWWDSSPTTWCDPSSGPRPSPMPVSPSPAWSTSPPADRCCWRANHRSYFDVAAIGLVAARINRPVRFWPNRRCSTRRSWAGWPGPRRDSRRTGRAVG